MDQLLFTANIEKVSLGKLKMEKFLFFIKNQLVNYLDLIELLKGFQVIGQKWQATMPNLCLFFGCGTEQNASLS